LLDYSTTSTRSEPILW